MKTRGQHTLHAWMNGLYVGFWQFSPRSGHAFEYSAAWLDSPFCRPISLSLPLRDAKDPWRGERVRTYFENLLPQSEQVRQRMCLSFGAASTSCFDLLGVVGHDCPGALQLTRGCEPLPGGGLGEPLSDADIEHLLDDLDQRGGLAPIATDGIRAALGGTRPKLALLKHAGRFYRPATGGVSSHILCLPTLLHADSGFALTHSLENAWLCRQVAAAFGVGRGLGELRQFGSHKVLIVEREDRRLDPDRQRVLCLPGEDLCQAFGLRPEQKYQIHGAPGLPRIAHLLLGSHQPAQDRLALLRTALVFWLLCAFDGHAKKFNIELSAQGRFTLGVPHGVLSAYPLLGRVQDKLSPDRIRMALGLDASGVPELWQGIGPGQWLDCARRCAVSSDEMATLMTEVAAQALQVSATLRKRLPAGFPVAVSEPVLQGIVHGAHRLRV